MFTLLMFSFIAIVFVIIAVSCYITHYLLVELPNKQMRIINQFVPCIVHQISQEYATLGIIQQRQIATEKIEHIFDELGVYSPSSAVEAAVSGALHQKKEAWIEELKTDQLADA